MIIPYARLFIGTPYKWGGKSPLEGFDCSGFVQECLKYADMDPPGDQSAQIYFDHFVKSSLISEARPGALVFYGKSTSMITHIALCTSEHLVIAASGGDSTTTSLSRAIEQRAFVKERPLNGRSDIVAIIMPNYPEWVKEQL